MQESLAVIDAGKNGKAGWLELYYAGEGNRALRGPLEVERAKLGFQLEPLCGEKEVFRAGGPAEAELMRELERLGRLPVEPRADCKAS